MILEVIDESCGSGDVQQFDFEDACLTNSLELSPLEISTLQVNITKLCNQACRHCHVDASPKRKEAMTRAHIETCLQILESHKQIATLDITGGAPELHPDFDFMVIGARRMGKHVIARHNLTVQLDGHPITGESKEYLPQFYADNTVEVVSSLPYYEEYFTDKQRGSGVFAKSITALQRLNAAGYGINEKLKLNLVYNPAGAFLPGEQSALERKFKQELKAKFNVVFNELYVITNMPIHRFKKQLKQLGQFENYMTKLVNAFNPSAAQNVMCRSLISVGFDGQLYDCDFNQMLDLQVAQTEPMTLDNFNYEELLKRRIVFGSHCFGCTAGSGSSCGGATAG
ncbi:MAG: arsenosugar biosynthesis radical SAM protein ArsS [Bdellovibrionales bacterium]|nr:arsenosugar biosynthesis radical SAM protein ArsS [Bdellovibrionales bacterium]